MFSKILKYACQDSRPCALLGLGLPIGVPDIYLGHGSTLPPTVS